MYNLPNPTHPHFLARYIKLVVFLSSRMICAPGYTEHHHILPRSMGGNDHPNNMVRVTAREHYILHWLLHKAYESPGMTYAFMMMNVGNEGQRRHLNSRLYEYARVEYSADQSVRMSGAGNPYYGKVHSAEVRAKISTAKKGKPNNSWNTGKTTVTDEKLAQVGRSISNSLIGYRHWTNGGQTIKSKECPGDGWVIGRAPNEKFKWDVESKALRKQLYSSGVMRWWNDGVNNKRQVESPGDEWKRGRLMSSSLYDKFCKKN